MQKLLLLHGALGAKAQFDPWMEHLQTHFEVYRMSFEGHGNMPGTTRPFRIEYFAENLAEFIREKDLGKADVFGYSMGGYVAMYLARQQPALLNRIFTFSTKYSWDPETSAREVKMLDPDIIENKVPKFARALEARHAGSNWKEVLHKTADMMLDLGAHNALLREDYSMIPHAVRVGIGDSDNMVTLDETIGVYRELTNGQLLVLPGTPHPLEKIDASRICQQITEFFIPAHGH